MRFRTYRLKTADSVWITVTIHRKGRYGAATAGFQAWDSSPPHSSVYGTKHDIRLIATFHRARTSDRVIRAGSKAHTWSLILSRPEDQGGNLVTYGATQADAAEKMALHLLANLHKSRIDRTAEVV